MADFELLLSATSEDIHEICEIVIDKYNVYLVGMTGQTGELMNCDQLDIFLNSDKLGRIIHIFSKNPYDKFKENPPKERESLPAYFDGAIRIIIPRRIEDGIERCTISARTFDVEEADLWKNIFKYFRKFAPLYNVYLISSDRNEIVAQRKHRIAKNALKLYNQGTRLYEYMFNFYYKIVD